MATLIQEIAGDALAGQGDNNTFSMTFDLDFPPTAAFIKVVLGQYYEWEGGPATAVFPGLVNIRRRKPDNSDETITFPNIATQDAVYVLFDPHMTHVTFGISVRNCIASLIWTHEVFV